MNGRLSLSSEQFNISGGKRQDSADTFLVLPSLETHSGETAALYVVTEASTPGPMGTRARRLVIDAIQEAYTSRFDLSPGPRLRAAIAAAHAELADEFKGHVRVGLSVLASDGTSVYLLQVPPAQAYVIHEGNLHSVGTTGSSKDSAFADSLGTPNKPILSLFRDTMDRSDIVVLCSTWFARELNAEEVRASFATADLDSVVTAMLDFAEGLRVRDATCLVVQSVRHQTVYEDLPRAPVEDGANATGTTLMKQRLLSASCGTRFWMN